MWDGGLTEGRESICASVLIVVVAAVTAALVSWGITVGLGAVAGAYVGGILTVWVLRHLCIAALHLVHGGRTRELASQTVNRSTSELYDQEP